MEKEIRAAGDSVPYPNVLFDESGNFVLVPTLLGIKVGHLAPCDWALRTQYQMHV